MEVPQLISAPRMYVPHRHCPQAPAERGTHRDQPSPSFPSSQVSNTNVSHTWGYVSVEPDHRAGEVPSHLPGAVGQQEVGYTKPPLLRPLPNFGEHFRFSGEIFRQFLEKLPSEVKTGRLLLENRRGFQGAIEAACFIKGRMIASNTQDAQRDVDQRLLQATWDILAFHKSKTNSSYPKRTEWHQLRAFLLGSQEVGRVVEDPNNVFVVADQTAGSAKPTKNPKDGGHDYAGDTQSAFDAYEGPPQIYPIQFQQNVADMSFMPVQNTDIGPYVYPVTYPPLQSDYLDQNIQPGFALQTYAAPALRQPIFQTLQSQLRDVAGPSIHPQTPVQEVQELDTGTVPGLFHGTKRSLDSSFQADQGFECVRARPAKRNRQPPTTPKHIASKAEAPGTEWIDDDFVDESSSSFANPKSKRKKVTNKQELGKDAGDPG